MSTFDSGHINVGRAVPIHLHRFFTLALLLLIPLSAIDSAEGGTTLPPYLQRLPTRQEPKNERKKESSDARRRRHLKIKKDCVALCFLSTLERKKWIGNVSHFVGKGFDGSSFEYFSPAKSSSKVSHGIELELETTRRLLV